MNNEREKYILALANLVNGSELGYEDISSIPQYKKDIENYVDSLEDKNQKYKEVIDRAINDLNIIIDIVREQPFGDCWIINRLEANKSILKEV